MNACGRGWGSVIAVLNVERVEVDVRLIGNRESGRLGEECELMWNGHQNIGGDKGESRQKSIMNKLIQIK